MQQMSYEWKAPKQLFAKRQLTFCCQLKKKGEEKEANWNFVWKMRANSSSFLEEKASGYSHNTVKWARKQNSTCNNYNEFVWEQYNKMNCILLQMERCKKVTSGAKDSCPMSLAPPTSWNVVAGFLLASGAMSVGFNAAANERVSKKRRSK